MIIKNNPVPMSRTATISRRKKKKTRSQGGALFLFLVGAKWKTTWDKIS